MLDGFSENTLGELPTIELFQSLGYEYRDCFHERFGEMGTLGRETSSDFVFVSKSKDALFRLKSDKKPEAIVLAAEVLSRTRDLLLLKLISGEIDVEELDTNTGGIFE